MIKIGSEVRFLNEVGGGRVVAFQNKNIAVVEDGDGFGIPMPVKELVEVVADTYQASSAPRTEEKEVASRAPAAVAAPNVPRAAAATSGADTGHSAELGFVPADIKRLSQTTFDLHLMNAGHQDFYYAVSICRDGRWTSLAHGMLAAGYSQWLCELDHPQLAHVERLEVQLLFFAGAGTPVCPVAPVSAQVRVDGVKFFKLHAFQENDWFDEQALVCPVLPDSRPAAQPAPEAGDLRRAWTEGKREQAKSQPETAKPKDKAGKGDLIEVDLHIHELLDDARGLTHADMLNYQLDKFREVMAANSRRKGQRIVFIHGKGEGVLRAAILSELKRRYPACTHQDASFQEYGFGATQVTIR